MKKLEVSKLKVWPYLFVLLASFSCRAEYYAIGDELLWFERLHSKKAKLPTPALYIYNVENEEFLTKEEVYQMLLNATGEGLTVNFDFETVLKEEVIWPVIIRNISHQQMKQAYPYVNLEQKFIIIYKNLGRSNLENREDLKQVERTLLNLLDKIEDAVFYTKEVW